MAKYATKSKPSQTRIARRELRQERRKGNVYALDTGLNALRPANEVVNTRPMEFKTVAQQTYFQMIESHDITFGTGPAGTGKTHVAADYAGMLLQQKKISQIVVCRPAVESGRGLGFTPGEIEDKFAPYFKPVRNILVKRFGETHLDLLIKRNVIEIAPIEFLRGNTFENAFVILDEAQNTTPSEMKTFLTRMGQHSTLVINGDIDQCDLDERILKGGPNGLQDALNRLFRVPGIAHFEFDEDDVVRHGLIKEILRRYRN